MTIIIAATNRKNSKSYEVASYYKSLLEGLGHRSELMSLEQLPIDFAFTALYENSGKNEAFNKMRVKLDVADKFVFIVPEYNGSFPGTLKMFIDGLGWPNSLSKKKVALVGISDGVLGGAHALSHLTDILHYLNCNVYSVLVRIALMKKNFINGEIQDKFLRELITEQAKGFIPF